MECDEESILKLYALAPELTYLKVWLCSPRTRAYRPIPTPTRIVPPTHLVELHVNVINVESFENVKLFIKYSQAPLRQLTLNLGQDLMVDGKNLEALLTPYTLLENFSFMSQFAKKQVNIPDLLRSFQSEWWLDTQRPPVLIHETDFKDILIASVPCSFTNIFKSFQFSSDLRSWHLNKETLDSRLIYFTRTRKISFSSKQLLSLGFLQFAGRIFCSQKQILECNQWGLISEHELFQQVSCFFKSYCNTFYSLWTDQ